PEARSGTRHRDREEALFRDRGRPDRRARAPRHAVLRSGHFAAVGRVDEPLCARARPPRENGPLRRRGVERLKGKVAVVTGGATGIGKAIARRLAQDGASVVIADLHKYGEAAAEIAQTTRSRTLGVQADVSNATDVSKMVSETVIAFGRLDILVN